MDSHSLILPMGIPAITLIAYPPTPLDYRPLRPACIYRWMWSGASYGLPLFRVSRCKSSVPCIGRVSLLPTKPYYRTCPYRPWCSRYISTPVRARLFLCCHPADKEAGQGPFLYHTSGHKEYHQQRPDCGRVLQARIATFLPRHGKIHVHLQAPCYRAL